MRFALVALFILLPALSLAQPVRGGGGGETDTFAGDKTVTGSVTVGTDLDVGDALTVDGHSELNGTVQVDGVLTTGSTTTIGGDVTPSANNTLNLGASATKWANTFSTIFTGNTLASATGSGLTLNSDAPDAGTGYALTTTRTMASGNLINISNNGTSRFTLNTAGTLSNVVTLSLNGGAVQQGAGGGGLQVRGNLAAGTNSPSLRFFNNAIQTGATASIAGFGNDASGSAWVLQVMKEGSLLFTPAAALPTCAAAREGEVMRDTASGGTSGNRTRLCFCTSDGGGTPTYAWVNLASGTVGNTTTCSN